MIDDLENLRLPPHMTGLRKQRRRGRPAGLALTHFIRVRASDLTHVAIKYLCEVAGGVSASEIVRQAVLEYIRKHPSFQRADFETFLRRGAKKIKNDPLKRSAFVADTARFLAISIEEAQKISGLE